MVPNQLGEHSLVIPVFFAVTLAILTRFPKHVLRCYIIVPSTRKIECSWVKSSGEARRTWGLIGKEQMGSLIELKDEGESLTC